MVEPSQQKTKRVVRNTCGEGERKRVKTDRRVMEWFWEHAQRISWKCHSHSVQTIDFGVVFKAAQLLPCQISFSELKQNGFTNLFSHCAVQSEGEAAWGERHKAGGVVRYIARPPSHTFCLAVSKYWVTHTFTDTLGYTRRAACWNRQRCFGLSHALCLVQMKMERGCSFCLGL